MPREKSLRQTPIRNTVLTHESKVGSPNRVRIAADDETRFRSKRGTQVVIQNMSAHDSADPVRPTSVLASAGRHARQFSFDQFVAETIVGKLQQVFRTQLGFA